MRSKADETFVIVETLICPLHMLMKLMELPALDENNKMLVLSSTRAEVKCKKGQDREMRVFLN